MNHLGTPLALALLAALPVLAWFLFRRRRSAVLFTSSRLATRLRPTWRTRLRWLPAAMRLACLALLIFALARPQETSGQTRTSTEGVAIQLVIDRSGSMREPLDLSGQEISKIDLVKRVVGDFVQGNGKDLKGRPGDMIGLITFGRYADTLAPLSRSHEPLLQAAGQIQLALTRGEDGTAIGEGLALAAARLKRAEEEVSRTKSKDGAKPEFTIKSKVVILLTDGQNNAGQVSPQEATELAKQWGIRVYTIGVGAGERYTVMHSPLFGDQRVRVGSDIDEKMLTDIAEATGGKYWPAESGESLIKAYAAIDDLEKTRIDSTEYTSYTERFAPFAAAGGILILTELLLASTALRRSP
jgi:Ca-activated chloride channel homolog